MNLLFSRGKIVILTASVMLMALAGATFTWQKLSLRADEFRLSELRNIGAVLRESLALIPSDSLILLDAFVQRNSEIAHCRITIISRNGIILADSEGEAGGLDNHYDRPEIAAALRGEVSSAERISPTTGQELFYVALPPLAGDDPVIRLSILSTSLKPDAASIVLPFGFLALAIILFGSALILFTDERARLRLRNLGEHLHDWRESNFERKLIASEGDPFGKLIEDFNLTSEQLGSTFGEILSQKNDLEAVLASMVEGVIAFDRDERIIRLNRAAERLFGVKSDEVVGRTLQETFRNPALQQFTALVTASRSSLEEEIVVDDGRLHLQTHGSTIWSQAGQPLGVLIVLNDVTKLRRLEAIRRDFVANVSHELRTPITSIKGFVETLQDGALADPENAKQFLDIIARQVDRMNSIIGDLLVLARLERGEETDGFAFTASPVMGVIKSAVEACLARANAKEIRFETIGDSEMVLPVNGPLLEQALINLIENAVAYSGNGTTIKISAKSEGAWATIAVEDEGQGIPPEHLSRIFERFYRVDRNRSRKVGGTGLGLAIVKHIAKAHHGRIEVQSQVGKGSVFTLFLPTE